MDEDRTRRRLSSRIVNFIRLRQIERAPNIVGGFVVHLSKLLFLPLFLILHAQTALRTLARILMIRLVAFTVVISLINDIVSGLSLEKCRRSQCINCEGVLPVGRALMSTAAAAIERPNRGLMTISLVGGIFPRYTANPSPPANEVRQYPYKDFLQAFPLTSVP